MVSSLVSNGESSTAACAVISLSNGSRVYFMPIDFLATAANGLPQTSSWIVSCR